MTNHNETIGIVLFNMGGPDSMDAVEPFLFNLFRDEDIIQLDEITRLPIGRFLQVPLARLISSKRAPKVAVDYEHLGGKSPLKETTWEQARLLEEDLHGREIDYNVRCFVAMRYWHPFTEEAIQSLQDEGITKVLLLSLYPHYSRATTGSSLKEWRRIVEERGIALEEAVICSYPEDPRYTEIIAGLLRETLATFPGHVNRDEVHVLFSAHGLPENYVINGDPYKAQIHGTVAGVMKDLPNPHTLAFQSQVGPIKWIKPSTPEVLEQLGSDGVKHVCIVPIAFVSEHIETLYEIDVTFGEDAANAGIETFIRVPTPGTDGRFIRYLGDLVTDYLREPHKGFTCHAKPEECCRKLDNVNCCRELNGWFEGRSPELTPTEKVEA